VYCSFDVLLNFTQDPPLDLDYVFEKKILFYLCPVSRNFVGRWILIELELHGLDRQILYISTYVSHSLQKVKIEMVI
jgi:hypothetical protein